MAQRTTDRFLSITETMEMTHLSRRTLRELRARDDHGGLPFYKPTGGKTVLYRESDVIAWLERGLVPSPHEPEAA
ncbi:helix-turn-helix transcriptional regulator [Leucobacter salsicius]|uniref:helix-turn-helix transcriptional regulator n=1 Tax=Leucobacter salsicius TaxID=664638 RepID=UPI00034CE4EF|nr:helix-turn-helix domain-containing protein [Leucobacter salsicius]